LSLNSGQFGDSGRGINRLPPALLFGREARAGALPQVYRVSSRDEDAAWRLLEPYRDKTFSFTDCTSFALMERLRLDTALALDGHSQSYGLHSLPEL